ncbi:MAG: glycosyltransferase [Saprospiraceae bacterium]|nr:glycosyltransferase [Saprospiraceae bacterium]
MSIIFLVGGCLCVGYIILIYNIYSNWGNYSPNAQKLDTIPNISIVIAARNEASSISACLESIYKNEYPFPNFEVIVVDDHSTDQTSQIVRSIDNQNISVTVLSSPGQGKKAAVDYGISMAKFPNILCTDADSFVSNQWLISHATSFNTTGIAMSCGVVLPTKGERFIENFQWLDFAATMAITSYGINKNQFYLANGANIGFTKVGFYGVNGFSGNAHLASGDDVFWLKSLPNLIQIQSDLCNQKMPSFIPNQQQTGLHFSTNAKDGHPNQAILVIKKSWPFRLSFLFSALLFALVS